MQMKHNRIVLTPLPHPHPRFSTNKPALPPHRVRLDALAVSQSIGELLQRAAQQLGLLPQVGSKETVGVGNSDKGSLEGVLEGLGGTGGRGVGVLDTSELEESLDGGGGNKASTTGGRDKL